MVAPFYDGRVTNSRFPKGLTKIKAIIQETQVGLIRRRAEMHFFSRELRLDEIALGINGVKCKASDCRLFAAYKPAAAVRACRA